MKPSLEVIGSTSSPQLDPVLICRQFDQRMGYVSPHSRSCSKAKDVPVTALHPFKSLSKGLHSQKSTRCEQGLLDRDLGCHTG